MTASTIDSTINILRAKLHRRALPRKPSQRERAISLRSSAVSTACGKAGAPEE